MTAADPTYVPKVHANGPDELVVESGGKITILSGGQIVSASGQATLADITLAAVTGVDGAGSNAASKADVDTRFATVQTAVNALNAAVRGLGSST